MADRISLEARSRNMAAIRGKNTKPELTVRRGLHAIGYRFRLHRRDLPGSPDIVFPSRRIAIEVRGCFFHRHGCANSALPKSRTDWWLKKLDGNVARDLRNEAALLALGWRLLVIWECDVRQDAEAVLRRAADILGPVRA
ncbi:very short patch repair endonuclease [Roseomonas fluvialis]|uniref:Very short patch repair endonuclease n=1 Tax=Roseomonas fluvialis TaxID=1750527 RepID=A0ABM7XXP0_9PROT|nr:very short patch repair endonuclease [Roseomonas fluvialis]BDG70243.1 very short patch repair endonuclease [Roseomonas fluvialis]